MDFIYRVHQVDFDPKDLSLWRKNWDWIIKAISISSESLANSINEKQPDELTDSVRQKVYKYLLRGRYRSTPFGYWAGVGTGVWAVNTKPVLHITDANPIQLAASQESIESIIEKEFKIAPGIKEHKGFYHYWSYSVEEEGWRRSSISKNENLELLKKHLDDFTSIYFSDFNHLFFRLQTNELMEFWGLLIDSGFLVERKFPISHSYLQRKEFQSIDLKVNAKVQVSLGVKKQLDQFIQEAGSLVAPMESDFLNAFKSWFAFTYDDRFIPLTFLESMTGLPYFPLVQKQVASMCLSTSLWGSMKEIDLKSMFKIQPLSNVSHLHFAYRLGDKDQIYVDNIAFNRPFAYSGRFSLDPELFKSMSDSIPDSLGGRKELTADLLLYESPKSNLISRHRNFYTYTINPFERRTEGNNLGIEDLYLGILDDEFVLFSTSLGRKVTPIVQHPLNPTMISHFLSRILWELAHQNQVKFLPYVHPAFNDGTYLPRLRWGDIVLQGRRWIVEKSMFPKKENLLGYFEKNCLPTALLVGQLDRELLLNWHDCQDFEIIWQELNSSLTLNLLECPWEVDACFYSENMSKVYPQIIYSKATNSIHDDKDLSFVNLISSHDPSWHYLRLFISLEAVGLFLCRTLPMLIKKICCKVSIDQWYYVVYQSPDTEVRIRIKPHHPCIDLDCYLEKELDGNPWVNRIIKAAYFPESAKYGKKGVLFSEKIFSWESRLILEGCDSNMPSYLDSEAVERVEVIYRMYCNLILILGLEHDFHAYSRPFVKRIPIDKRRELKKIACMPVEIPFRKDMADQYLGLFMGHEMLKSEKCILFLTNHIHMFCNRMFGVNEYFWELLVIYKLDQYLGRSLYKQSV